MAERLRSGLVAAGMVGALALTACGTESDVQVSTSPSRSVATGTPTPDGAQYALKPDAQGRLIDQEIAKKPERGVTSVTVFYDPTTEGGSIQAEVCFKAATNFRVTTQELSPKPGFIVDKPFEMQGPGCVVKRPVIQLGSQDHERFYLGVGSDKGATYKNMMVYDITSKGFKPIVERRTNQSIPPNPKLRG